VSPELHVARHSPTHPGTHSPRHPLTPAPTHPGTHSPRYPGILKGAPRAPRSSTCSFTPLASLTVDDAPVPECARSKRCGSGSFFHPIPTYTFVIRIGARLLGARFLGTRLLHACLIHLLRGSTLPCCPESTVCRTCSCAR
jgi:hypothetical protein